jgi:anti-sigma-K factor RskA
MMQRSHEWFVETIPAYAIGAADDDEREAVEEHLRACPTCRAQAEEFRGLGDALLFAAPVTHAPTGMTERLRKRLNAPQTKGAPGRSGFSFLRKPAFALGIVALALLALTNVYWAGRVGELERRANEFAALAQAPGITLNVSNAPDSPYRNLVADGVVYAQPNSNVALLCVYDLPQLEPGKTYQAWLIRDGQRTSGGTFNVNQDGYGVLLIDAGKPVGEYQQLGITVEPAGGSPAPTTPRVMGGEL